MGCCAQRNKGAESNSDFIRMLYSHLTDVVQLLAAPTHAAVPFTCFHPAYLAQSLYCHIVRRSRHRDNAIMSWFFLDL